LNQKRQKPRWIATCWLTKAGVGPVHLVGSSFLFPIDNFTTLHAKYASLILQDRLYSIHSKLHILHAGLALFTTLRITLVVIHLACSMRITLLIDNSFTHWICLHDYHIEVMAICSRNSTKVVLRTSYDDRVLISRIDI
jgi:hypothetical protein